MNKQIWFISSDENKYEEFEKIASVILGEKKAVELIKFHEATINEIQTKDMKQLISNKALEAFKKIKRPLIVEHTSLHLQEWSDFPGGLTSIIWSELKEQGILQLAKKKRKVVAQTYLGYIDGKRLHIYTGEIKGKLSQKVQGGNGFGWDSIFIPKGYKKTLSEMTIEEKNEVSMRRKAIEKFLEDMQTKGELQL
ncbi:non-canonical purine NTP pyrophosphatase [Paenibacillus shenyangensis]|uniref:non-canonical purine NTP pyrophosphatase n=1 Tax=Paenibacillus sp. A9 TaxID=1284352 RepID=UPI000369B5E7|nr:non-canonical purine NTP pyrophosphatase [Paenibacillus sp. A9]